MRQLGANPSMAGGTALTKGSTTLLGPMACVELLQGQYKYHVHFGRKVSQEVLEKLQSSADKDVEFERDKSESSETDSPRKRKRFQNDDEDETVPSKVCKFSADPTPSLATRASTRLANSKTTKLLSEPSTSKQTDAPKQSSLDAFFTNGGSKVSSERGEWSCCWKEERTMLILQYGASVYSSKLACFDLDGTLIVTASGKKYVASVSM